MKFNSPKCKNCTAKAVNENTIEDEESATYVGKEYEQVGVIGTVRFEEELHVQIELQGETVKDDLWQFRKFQSVYDRQYREELPPHLSFDHAIDMVDGKEPPWAPIYALSEKELGVLKVYLDTMWASSEIHSCNSPASAPILFVPKKECIGLCLGVHHRGLNKVRIVNRYPHPVTACTWEA